MNQYVWGDDLIDDMVEVIEDDGNWLNDWWDTHETVIVEHKYVELANANLSSDRGRNEEDKRGINPVRQSLTKKPSNSKLPINTNYYSYYGKHIVPTKKVDLKPESPTIKPFKRRPYRLGESFDTSPWNWS